MTVLVCSFCLQFRGRRAAAVSGVFIRYYCKDSLFRYILYICSYGTVKIFSQNQPNLSFFFSAVFVCTPVLGIPPAKIFRFSVLLLLLIVKQMQQQTSAEGGSGLNVKRPAVLMIKSQFEGKCSHSAALLFFSQLAAHQLYLCSCSLFSPEKEI